MRKLTRVEKNVLRMIERFAAKNQRVPSYGELADRAGFNRFRARAVIKSLIANGALVEAEPGSERSYALPLTGE